MSVLSEESGSSVLTGETGDTEDFWNRKKESLQSIRKTIRNGKRTLLIKRATPGVGRRNAPASRPGIRQQPGPGLSTIHEPRVIDHTNYRNYLKRRFPNITGAAAADSAAPSERSDSAADLREYASVVRPSRRSSGPPDARPPARPSRMAPRGGPLKMPTALDDDMLESYIYFCENRQFAHDFVEAFIGQHLDEDEIPDVLIDSMASLAEPAQRRRPTKNPLDSARSSEAGSYVGGGAGRHVGFRTLRPLPPVSRGRGDDDSLPLALEDDDSELVADVLRRAAAARHRRPARNRSSPARSPTPPPERGFEPQDATAVDAMQLLLRDALPDLLRDAASEAVVEASRGIVASIDIADIMAPHILDETLNELIAELCSQSVKQLAMQEVAVGHHYDVFLELVDELVQEFGPSIARKAVGEDFLESMLDELIEPVADAMAAEVAADLLTDYDTRLRRRDLKEIKRTAKDKPLDTLIFQQLVEKLAQGDSLLITSRTLHHFVEATEMDILLKQLALVSRARRLTLESAPVRALHQRLFTDVALDVITDEMLEQVDADLADLDFDEVEDAMQKRYIKDIGTIYNTNSTG